MVLADEGCIMYCLFSILKTKADIGGKIDYCRMCYIITSFFLSFFKLWHCLLFLWQLFSGVCPPPKKKKKNRGGVEAKCKTSALFKSRTMTFKA